jgi:hypothetical protein
MMISRRTMLRARASRSVADPRRDDASRGPRLAPKRRFVAVNLGLGLHAAHFVPATAGAGLSDEPLSEV